MPAFLTAFRIQRKKFKKKGKPSHCVMLCQLVAMKNNKLAIWQLFPKGAPGNDLPGRKIHGLSSQMSQLMTLSMAQFIQMGPYRAQVCTLEWQTMFIKGVFAFFAKKCIFLFRSAKMFFVKQLLRTCLKNAPPQHSHIVDHIVWTIHQLDASQKLSRHFSIFIQLSADLAGSAANLNYRCFLVCS